MQFKEAVETCLKHKYADFNGRASRSEYWWFSLFSVLATIAAMLLGLFIFGEGKGLVLIYVAVVLCLFVPSLAVGVRRLHDTGKSGWWYLITLVPYVGGIVLLVFFLLDSQPEANQYGPNPKGGCCCCGSAKIIEAEVIEIKEDTDKS